MISLAALAGAALMWIASEGHGALATVEAIAGGVLVVAALAAWVVEESRR